MPYRTLSPKHIVATAQTLSRRVEERFPEAGLNGVAKELVCLAQDAAEHAASLAAPILWLRFLVAGVIARGAGISIFVGTFITFSRIDSDGFGFFQGIESLINTLVLAGLGLFGLIRMEERLKRHAVLKGLHRLRSMVHIIDMHQLTKDPAVFEGAISPTASSPKRTLTRAELTRYLDYCSEMMSLAGKVAALTPSRSTIRLPLQR